METEEVRKVQNEMTSFWRAKPDPVIENMLLDEKARDLSVEEMPEILSILPSWDGRDVVELGAGIGRFTGVFARSASHVVAVDFMEEYVARNKLDNAKFTNIEYHCVDATKLRLEENKFDLIFSNWLLMYLHDDAARELLARKLSWLRDGGHLFIRESCGYPSGNLAGDSNPTIYRDADDYTALFNNTRLQDGEGGEVKGFEILTSKPLQCYIKISGACPFRTSGLASGSHGQCSNSTLPPCNVRRSLGAAAKVEHRPT
ncbi:PEAMT-like protein, partial [Mya arenaria]